MLGAVVLSCSPSRGWLGGEGQRELVEWQGGATDRVTSLGCRWRGWRLECGKEWYRRGQGAVIRRQ